jgi:ATP-dependent protease ClpP protease subunit
MSKSWYSIQNKATGVLDISIHDEIGFWGITAKDFLNDINAHDDVTVINLSIHSPGGSMIDGFAMYNALKNHPAKVYGHVEGVAASMAGVVLMAADVRSMPTNAYIMTHAPQGGAMGESKDLRKVADIMDKFRDSAMGIFREATNLSDEDISAFLDDETWFNGEEALANGLVHTLTDAVDVAAKATGFEKHFKSMPIENSHKKVEDIHTIKDFERFLRDVGNVSKGLATALSSRAKIVFQGEPEIDGDAAMRELSAVLSRVKIPEKL